MSKSKAEDELSSYISKLEEQSLSQERDISELSTTVDTLIGIVKDMLFEKYIAENKIKIKLID